MHPLPSVTVLPFPRAPHQGPLLADAQGAVGPIIHVATGAEERGQRDAPRPLLASPPPTPLETRTSSSFLHWLLG